MEEEKIIELIRKPNKTREEWVNLYDLAYAEYDWETDSFILNERGMNKAHGLGDDYDPWKELGF